MVGLLGILGKAAWKVVRWSGTKYKESSKIESLLRDVQEKEEAVKPK